MLNFNTITMTVDRRKFKKLSRYKYVHTITTSIQDCFNDHMHIDGKYNIVYFTKNEFYKSKAYKEFYGTKALHHLTFSPTLVKHNAEILHEGYIKSFTIFNNKSDYLKWKLKHN